MASEGKDGSGRKFFRIPVDETSKVGVTIASKQYNVLNLASGGVGIYLNKDDTFAKGEKITDIMLTIDDVSCHVTGCIAHVSPEDIDYLCGIELLEMSPEASELLQHFVDSHKTSLFSFMPN